MKAVVQQHTSSFTAGRDEALQDSLTNKISFYHLGLFLVMLPFDLFYSELILISLSLHTLIHINKKKIGASFTRQNLVLSSVFLLNVLGLIWSRDREEGLEDIGMQFSIILFPFIFSASGLNLNRYKKKLLLLFGATCTVTIVFLYTDAIHIILYNKLSPAILFSPAFINHNFSQTIPIHATYMSMYTALSIASFLYFFPEEKSNRTRFLYIIAITILVAGLLQLASRSVLIATIIFITTGFFLSMPKGTKRTRFIVITILVSLICLFGITMIDSFKKRYISELEKDLTQVSVNNEIPEPRIVRWQYTLPLVKNAPVIGHGSGSEKRLLKEMYFEKKLYNSFLHELNAHNQYLSFFIKTGVIGLIILLVTFYSGLVAAWRRKDRVFWAFMILISIVSFSENILDVNKGIFFYAFFFSFFVKTGKPLRGLFRLGDKK
ncbi:MAG: O-antigen ligase family protein [Bacteroidota bacterium]|nr:O-antigen ligase family protein [Bacteroidota bacterium]